MSFDFLAESRLPSHEERLRILAFAAKFEASEVLVPRPVWSLGRMSPPFFKGEDILDRNFTLLGAIEEVLS